MNWRAPIVAKLDLVNINTADGDFGFIAGLDGRFTDVNGKTWIGSSLIQASAQESALNGKAPAKGKAFLGRKPAEVLPSALAELAATLLQEPVLPDTEIVLRHGEEQQYLSVRGGHVNEGYEGRLGSLMFLRDLTEVRRLEAEVRRREKLAAVGNLAAGVTGRKLGTTGTASPKEMLALYHEQFEEGV